MADLTDKQKRFVEEYIIDLNATAAYIRAGYEEKGARANAARLIANDNIQSAIQKSMDARSKRTEITADRVLQEYAKLGFSNIADYLKVEETAVVIDFVGEGELKQPVMQNVQTVRVFDTDTIERAKLDAVAEIKQTKEGIALKLHDKKGALDSIARHLGMFTDNTNVNVKGGMSNTTEDLTGLSPEERRARIDELNRRRGNGAIGSS